MSCKNDGISSALMSGGLLIAVGVLLLLNQMGVIHHWFNFWALVFFFVGMLNIVQESVGLRADGRGHRARTESVGISADSF